jgi:LacI family transcriptional regulator
MPVRLQDIARSLDVSVVTVSKVLRNQGKISTATRKRVLRRAKQLNYQANWIARSLVMRRTFTVGLLLPDFTHPFFAEVTKAVAQTVRPQGYHLILSYFEEDPELERTEADSLIARQVDGLIAATAQSRPDWFEGILKRKLPLVLIDRPIPGLPASFVGTDNETVGKLATSHLIALGCRRIAHLRGPGIGIAAARLAGYRQALKKHNITVPSRYVLAARYVDHSGYTAMRKLLKSDPIPDGVFCYNDPVAIGAMKAISEAGLRIPQDIAVVGAGNVQYSDVLAIPLTTVDQGAAQMGRQAAEFLMEQIGAKHKPRIRRVLIPPRLVVRQSTQRT